MASLPLGRRMLRVAAVEESPQASLHAGLFRTVPHRSALCAYRFPLRSRNTRGSLSLHHRAGQPRRSDVSGSERRDSKSRGRIRCFVSRFSLCHWTLSRWTRPVAAVVWGSILTPRCPSPLNRGPRGGSLLFAGDALQDDQGKCRCVCRVGGWAGLGVGFEGRFSFVS